MKIFFLLLTVCPFYLFSSCCDTEAYEAQLQTWINRSESELLSSWGIPTKTYDIDNNTKLLSFNRSRTQLIEGRAPSVTYDEEKKGDKKRKTVHYDNGSPDRVVTYHCRTTFTIKNKKVIAWKWDGDDCCG